MDTILQVKDLKKYFPTRDGLLQAVDGVNFSLERGKTLGVVGESGCGKSTLGRMIVHLLDRTDGQIIFNGEDISDAHGKKLLNLRQEIQMIFQDPFSSLDPRKNVSQAISEPMYIHKMYNSKEEINRRTEELMDIVGLAQRYKMTYPHELDGGRRQRIGIARALAVNPSFIVCDEPVSALDVSIQAQILNLLMDLQRDMNLTYLFITHNLSVVKHISDEIAVMYLGQMVEKCDSDELFAHHYHPYTKALLSAIPIPKCDNVRRERVLLRGEITSPINCGEGCRFAKRCIYAQTKCIKETPQSEEVTPSHYVACHRARELNDL